MSAGEDVWGGVLALQGSRRVGWSLSACGEEDAVPVSTAFGRQL